jgi:translation initiation factor 2 alpha subunit (eIF-2alpha)
MNLEVGDVVLCTVDRIVGTIVFVRIEGNGEGSIIMSEIAPGRIRNLRDYVVPKKKIVCKILRMSGDRIDLSLRRVTQKEQKEIKEQYKQEKSGISILKSVLGKKVEKVVEQILKEERIYEFLQEAKEDSKKLENLVGKTDSQKILEILQTQKQKKAIVKKDMLLTTTAPNGLELIKNILGGIKEAEIKYISAGKYSIKIEATNPKEADNKIKEITSVIEKESKKQGLDFSVKGK